MKIKLSKNEFNNSLKKLKEKYKLFAPVSLAYKGTYSDTDVVRYKEIEDIEEIELNKKSNFSPKEIVLPISETLFYFTEDEFKEANQKEDKDILIFLRACDINGIKRIDQIYLENGKEEDYFYKRIREKVKFVLIGCSESFRNCFCVSMDSNKTDNYSIGLNFRNDEVQLHINDEAFSNYFDGENIDFEIDYVKENDISISVNENINPLKVSMDDMWREYDDRCIACGRCNFVCPTCTCFTMQDIFYKENENVGERRRVWASCHVDRYTDMAGGHSFRKLRGDRMRFKTLHKIYDFNKRFGYQMCVGCGRCDDACPQYISFSTCIEKVNDLVNKEEK